MYRGVCGFLLYVVCRDITFWDAFVVLLVAFCMTLGTFWGVSGGLLGTPGGLGERLGGISGTKCLKKTSQIPERAAQVLPKGGQGSPRGP